MQRRIGSRSGCWNNSDKSMAQHVFEVIFQTRSQSLSNLRHEIFHLRVSSAIDSYSRRLQAIALPANDQKRLE